MLTTIQPEVTYTIAPEQITKTKDKQEKQTPEIKREVLQNLENAPEEILNELGGAALDRIFPEITADIIKQEHIEELTKHFVFRNGNTITPLTRTVYIPKKAYKDPKIVENFLTYPFREMKQAAVEGSLHSMEVAISPNIIPERFTERQKTVLDEGSFLDTENTREGYDIYKKVTPDPKSDSTKGAKYGETPKGFESVQPALEPEPETKAEPEFYIQPVTREGQFPQLIRDESNLAAVYTAAFSPALNIYAPEKLIEKYNPRLLSPDLIILDSKDGKKRTVATYREEDQNHSFKKAEFYINDNTGTEINRWLHSLGPDKFEMTAAKNYKTRA